MYGTCFVRRSEAYFKIWGLGSAKVMENKTERQYHLGLGFGDPKYLKCSHFWYVVGNPQTL